MKEGAQLEWVIETGRLRYSDLSIPKDIHPFRADVFIELQWRLTDGVLLRWIT